MEEWRDYHRYKVSNRGQVRSLRGNRVLKPDIDRDGYETVRLHNEVGSGDKVKTKMLVSRMVASAFIINPENKPTVDHINGNRRDNRVENLRWATIKEQNMNRRYVPGSSGETNIRKHSDNSYEVSIKRSGTYVFQKNFKTLPEAIKARDEFLSGK
jgi:hypothetical protein